MLVIAFIQWLLGCTSYYMFFFLVIKGFGTDLYPTWHHLITYSWKNKATHEKRKPINLHISQECCVSILLPSQFWLNQPLLLVVSKKYIIKKKIVMFFFKTRFSIDSHGNGMEWFFIYFFHNSEYYEKFSTE